MSIYKIDSQLPAFIEREKTQTQTLPVQYAGVTLAPVSGTYTLYDASKVVVKTGAIVVNSANEASFTLDDSDLPSTLTLSDRYQEHWVLTFAEPAVTVETFRRNACLCLRLLSPVVTDSMIRRRVADLDKIIPTTIDSMAPYIDEAWGVLNRIILSDGKRPYLIMNEFALADWHLALTLQLFFEDMSTYMGEGRYSTRAAEYAASAVKLYEKLRLEYDTSENDTRATADTSVPMQPVLYGNFAPARGWVPSGRGRR